jgi:hypothetical protein
MMSQAIGYTFLDDPRNSLADYKMRFSDLRESIALCDVTFESSEMQCSEGEPFLRILKFLALVLLLNCLFSWLVVLAKNSGKGHQFWSSSWSSSVSGDISLSALLGVTLGLLKWKRAKGEEEEILVFLACFVVAVLFAARTPEETRARAVF